MSNVREPLIKPIPILSLRPTQMTVGMREVKEKRKRFREQKKKKQVETLGRAAASVLRVFQHMQRNPIVSIPAAAQKIGISAPTVAKSLDHMQRLGILREITGRERHRLFVYEGYLAILNEGTEAIR